MSSDFISYWQERLDFLDVHYHASPDAYKRKFNAIEAGTAYQAIRGGVLLKSHLGCTSAVAATAQSMGLPVFGSVALNSIAGGLDLRSIKQSLCYYNGNAHCGRLVVDLPTVVASQHLSKLQRAYANDAVKRFAQEPCFLGDDQQVLFPCIEEVLDFCNHESVVLTTGHATRAQLEALVNLCVKKGGVRLLLNQPANPMTKIDVTTLKSLGQYDWLYVEQTALTLLLGYQTQQDFDEVLANVHNVVYSSDLGQLDQLSPQQWLNQSQTWFDSAKPSAVRVQAITLLNPLQMLTP
jgi:hypothetical protein